MFKKTETARRIFLIFCAVFVINGMVNGALAADRDVIIGFHQSDDKTKEKLVRDNGGKVKKTFHIISAVSASVSDENITKMKKDPRVAYIENDSVYQAADEYTNSWGVQHIGSRPVHNQSINGAGVKIAVLDTGIDYNHEDLKNNYKGGYDFINNDADPWDDNCESYYKTCHGTHVSGIIAAENNGIGVVGVAPGASIYAVKVLNGGGFGSASLVISGIEWAVDNDMNIISMSIESTESGTAVLEAVNVAYNSGILLVAAGGNYISGSGPVKYPAAYDSVIAVSSIDANDQIASTSAIGTEIELAAPGVNVYSTVEGGYAFLSGTSMAAPHVTGVAALIYSTDFADVNGDGENDNKDVRAILQQTAKDIGDSGRDIKYGFGVVDAPMSVLGTPVPGPESFDLTLIRTKGSPADDTQKVDLPQGDYSIDIRNVNLKEVKMRVYENGVLQKHLSRDFKFNSKIKEVSFNLTVNSVTVAFIPDGKNGSIGYVTIRRL